MSKIISRSRELSFKYMEQPPLKYLTESENIGYWQGMQLLRELHF